MGLKNDRYYFSLFPSKRNFFIFKQLSFLQKLMFISISLLYYCTIPFTTITGILLTIFMREHFSVVIDSENAFYDMLICNFVFLFFIRYNYKLGWKDVIFYALDSKIEYNCYPEHILEFWERRQKIIDRMAEIYNL